MTFFYVIKNELCEIPKTEKKNKEKKQVLWSFFKRYPLKLLQYEDD